MMVEKNQIITGYLFTKQQCLAGRDGKMVLRFVSATGITSNLKRNHDLDIRGFSLIALYGKDASLSFSRQGFKIDRTDKINNQGYFAVDIPNQIKYRETGD